MTVCHFSDVRMVDLLTAEVTLFQCPPFALQSTVHYITCKRVTNCSMHFAAPRKSIGEEDVLELQ